ncbi:activating signal cointegrator 1 complex subunit 3-like [Oncorhynchus mykiss]|uniref:activating signal cointegrator 1 complex subunit 3-like n=1 Tax=Oncorhynchus mykiss TaxID=8022 RepID=UPI0018789438|nr:activating signal cointegrator 1 complex subunit 3-like [Oncorhynchus mykiss]
MDLGPDVSRKGGGVEGSSKPTYGCQVTIQEQALLTARWSPVLSRERVYKRVRYPNVYDCYAEATKTSAFVGGAKLMLPEGIKRENNKMYEEVEIPPSDPMSIGFEEKPIYM